MDLQNKTILIIGDSLSVPDQVSPGSQLAKLLTTLPTPQQGAKGVRFDAVRARSAHSFLADGGAQLAADAALKADVVIIILGTNDACLKQIDEKEYAALAAPFLAYGATLLVFGPPWYPDGVKACGKNTKELNAAVDLVAGMMAKVYGKAFIDSRPLTTMIGIDGRSGVHFTKIGAAVWANNMAAAIKAASGKARGSRAGRVILALALLAGAGAGGWWLLRKKKRYLNGVRARFAA